MGISNYEFQISTDVNFSTIYDASTPTTSYYQPSVSYPSGVYYWRVRAKNNANNYGPWTVDYQLIIDTIVPTIVNTEISLPLSWANSVKPAGYDIDFYEVGSKISDIQYKVHTLPSEGGSVLVNWETIRSTQNWTQPAFTPPLNLTSYTTNFAVNFNLLQNGTNYVSIRVIDLAGNTSTWIDAFRILKDVIPPTINNLQTGDYTWRNSSGTTYSVFFNDTGENQI